MTREQMIQQVAELSRQVGAEKARGDLSAAKVADLSAEIKTMRQELAESRAAGSLASALGPESGLKKYLLTSDMVAGLAKSGAGQAATEGALVLRGYQDRETATWVPGLLDEAPVCDWQRDLQEAVTQRNIVSVLRGKAGSPKSDRAVTRVLDRAPDAVRRAAGFDTFRKAFVDVSGSGAEWIIDLGLPMVERDPRLVGQIEGLFQVHPMAAQTELLPFLTTGLRPYKHAGATGDDPAQLTSSSATTAQRTITATGMDVRAQVDEDAAEDAIIPGVPFLQSEIVLALANGMEDCIVNGDTAGTHQDTGLASWDIRGMWGSSGLGGAGDHRRTFIGLRARAADVSCTTDGSAAETYAGMVSTLAKLDSPHGRQAGTVFVTSLEWMLVKMLNFAEFQGSQLVGALNSVLTGEVLLVAGKRVYLSDFVDKEYNASGIYDNSTKTKTGLLTVNTDRFWITQRKGVSVELYRDPTRSVINLIARNRKGFFTPDSSTRKNVHWYYKLSPS
jgi:hypothetical protein